MAKGKEASRDTSASGKRGRDQAEETEKGSGSPGRSRKARKVSNSSEGSVLVEQTANLQGGEPSVPKTGRVRRVRASIL